MDELTRAARLDRQLRAAEVVTAIQPRDARGRLMGRRRRLGPAGTRLAIAPAADTPPAIA